MAVILVRRRVLMRETKKWLYYSLVSVSLNFMATPPGWAEPTLMVVAGNDVKCQAVLYTVGLETGKIITEKTLLDKKIPLRFMPISPNQDEAGLIYFDGEGSAAFKGEGNVALAVVDLLAKSVKKHVIFGHIQQVGIPTMAYPPARILFTDKWDRIQLSETFEIQETLKAGHPVYGEGARVDSLYGFTRSTASNSSEEVEMINLRDRQVVGKWKMKNLGGWRLSHVIAFHAKEKRFLISLTKGEYPNYENKNVVGAIKGEMIQIVKDLSSKKYFTFSVSSPDSNVIFGQDFVSGEVQAFDLTTYQERVEIELKNFPQLFRRGMRQLTISPDGTRLVLLFSDASNYRKNLHAPGYLLIWEIINKTGKVIEIPAGRPVGAVFNPK